MARLIDEPNGLPLCPDFGRCIAKPQAAGQKYTCNQMCLQICNIGVAFFLGQVNFLGIRLLQTEAV